MESKRLDVTDMTELKEKVSDVQTWGEPGEWKLICKAWSERQRWMRSTKAMEIRNIDMGYSSRVIGCLIQVSTVQGDDVAEAVVFAPGVMIMDVKDETGTLIGRKLVISEVLLSRRLESETE